MIMMMCLGAVADYVKTKEGGVFGQPLSSESMAEILVLIAHLNQEQRK